MKSIVIREYQDSDLKEISNIVVRNMLEINSKDYGLSEMRLRAQEFNEKEMEKSL